MSDPKPDDSGNTSATRRACECEHVDGKCAYCKRREACVPDPGVMFPW